MLHLKSWNSMTLLYLSAPLKNCGPLKQVGFLFGSPCYLHLSFDAFLKTWRSFSRKTLLWVLDNLRHSVWRLRLLFKTDAPLKLRYYRSCVLPSKSPFLIEYLIEAKQPIFTDVKGSSDIWLCQLRQLDIPFPDVQKIQNLSKENESQSKSI